MIHIEVMEIWGVDRVTSEESWWAWLNCFCWKFKERAIRETKFTQMICTIMESCDYAEWTTNGV
jgi:hypothetical protein